MSKRVAAVCAVLAVSGIGFSAVGQDGAAGVAAAKARAERAMAASKMQIYYDSGYQPYVGRFAYMTEVRPSSGCTTTMVYDYREEGQRYVQTHDWSKESVGPAIGFLSSKGLQRQYVFDTPQQQAEAVAALKALSQACLQASNKDATAKIVSDFDSRLKSASTPPPQCHMVKKTGVGSSTFRMTRAEAESGARRDMELKCPGGAYTASDWKCEEKPYGGTVQISKDGKVGPTTRDKAWVCQAKFLCSTPTKVCPSRSVGASKQ